MFSSNEYEDRLFFKALYEKYFGKVYRFLLKNTRNESEAEDFSHDVFLKLWQHRESFSHLIPADAQLLVIARQVVINNYKRRLVKQRVLNNWQKDLTLATANDSTEELIRTKEMSVAIEEAVLALPPKRREIFEKSRYQGLSYDEIAAEMAISRNTVESQMVKALHFLRRKLAFLPVLIFFIKKSILE
jgi:RNA polymerase sigma-70 factor (family 1)